MLRRQLLSGSQVLSSVRFSDTLIQSGGQFYAWRSLHATSDNQDEEKCGNKKPCEGFTGGSSPDSAVQPTSENYIYSGPFSSTVTRLKQLSLFSCACALASGPIIFGLDTSMTLPAKTGVVATLSSFGIFTTGIMHWFTSPYAHKLEYNPADDSVEVVCLNLFAKPVKYRFHIAEVRQVDSVHPLSSFSAQGKMFYVDQDNFSNKRLLNRLIASPLVQNDSQNNSCE